jgi:ribonuclease P protein component
MIDRTHRFHGYNSLRFVYGKGQTIRGAQVAMRYIENTRRQQWRAAVVVSRKVSKSAVVRNKIRRRIYEIVRANQDFITKPYDLVFLVYSPLLNELEFTKVSETIVDLLTKSGVMSEKLPQLSSASHGIVDPKEK